MGLIDVILFIFNKKQPVPKESGWPVPTETVCPVHGVDLRDGKAAIAYGLYSFPDDLNEAAEAHFPFANSEFMGGCCLPAKGPWYAPTKYCPVCRKNEKAYWDAQPS